MLYAVAKNLFFRPVVTLLYRARIEGEENIPASGGVILASNHLSAGETFLIPSMIHRELVYPAKAELFHGKGGLGSKVVAWFMKASGQVPLDRSGGRANLDGLGPVIKVLHDGGLVAIYPEGTRSPDGRLFKGKTGVARMALAARVPVVPVGVVRTEMIKKFGLPWMDRPVVRVGKPLDFSAYYDQPDNRRVLRWVTDEVMNAIVELSGQTYVEAYGTSVKSGSLSSEEATARVRPRPGGDPAPPIKVPTP
ncbi:MAG: lysophospholipid acyltransferase family protein [Micropruina sp.]|nr:1-acyl-sn-glycerol-3-phosphate acyltransferase [Micropruina sp.]